MDRYDVLLVMGCVIVAVGIGLVSLPAALVVWGVELIGLSVLWARARVGRTDR